jgi:hypothetical protein
VEQKAHRDRVQRYLKLLQMQEKKKRNEQDSAVPAFFFVFKRWT